MLKRFSAAVVVAAFAAAFGIAPVLASPAATRAPGSAAAAGPLCTGYMTASPISQTLSVNQTANVTAYWYCEGTFDVVSNIDWKDGNSDNYTCWSNCSSGQNTFSHVYTKRGTFYAHLWMNAHGSGAYTVTINVV